MRVGIEVEYEFHIVEFSELRV